MPIDDQANGEDFLGSGADPGLAHVVTLDVNAIADEMCKQWRKGHFTKVESLVECHSGVDSGILLELAYQEFHLASEFGLSPSVDEYCERFPTIETSFRRQVAINNAIEQAVERSDFRSHGGLDLPEVAQETVTFSSEECTPEDLSLIDSYKRLGRFLVIHEIGSGGQATLYRAIDPFLDRDVVLKISHHRLSEIDPSYSKQIISEGKLLASLNSSGLIRVYSAEVIDDRFCLVLESVRGVDLHQHVSTGGSSWEETCGMLVEVARGLQDAHGVGILHLDITPRNILVDMNGKAKLIDFGLGHQLSPWQEGEGEKSISGTIDYMAPEQAIPKPEEVSIRTDVFGLGGVLLFCLSGESPRQNVGGLSDRLDKARLGYWSCERLESLNIPDKVKDVCRKALAVQPCDRYPSALAFATSLESSLSRDASPMVDKQGQMTFPRRSWLGLFVSIGVISVLTFLFKLSRGDKGWSFLRPVGAISLDLSCIVFRGDRAMSIQDMASLMPGDEMRMTLKANNVCSSLLLTGSDGGVCKVLSSVEEDCEMSLDMTLPSGDGEVFTVTGDRAAHLVVALASLGRIDVKQLQESLSEVLSFDVDPFASVLTLTPSEVIVDDMARDIGGTGPGQMNSAKYFAYAERIRRVLLSHAPEFLGYVFWVGSPESSSSS